MNYYTKQLVYFHHKIKYIDWDFINGKMVKFSHEKKKLQKLIVINLEKLQKKNDFWPKTENDKKILSSM